MTPGTLVGRARERSYRDGCSSGVGQRSRAAEGFTSVSASGEAGNVMYRFLECTAGQYMTPGVVTVTRRVTMNELQALFEKHDFNAFPVLEEGRLLGVVTKFDFLRAFAFATGQMLPRYNELMQRTVADVMTEAVVHVEPSAPLTRVLQLIVNLRARSLPVVSDGQLIGIISREDIMRALKETTRGAI